MGSPVTKALHLLVWAKTQEPCLDIGRASTLAFYLSPTQPWGYSPTSRCTPLRVIPAGDSCRSESSEIVRRMRSSLLAWVTTTRSAYQPTDAPASRRGPLSHEFQKTLNTPESHLNSSSLTLSPSPQTPLFTQETSRL